MLFIAGRRDGYTTLVVIIHHDGFRPVDSELNLYAFDSRLTF